MKKYRYILISCLTAIIASCDSFLNVEPVTTLVDKNFYKTVDDMRSALYSTYSMMATNGMYNESILLFNDVRSDVAFPNQTNFLLNIYRHEIENFSITANNTGNSNYWSAHFEAIKRANIVILYGEERFAHNTTVQTYIEEAKVLRALFYFNLVRAYGGVPLVLDVPDTYEDASKHIRVPAKDIYLQIITDLEQAIESNRLGTKTTTPKGRVYDNFAKGLLAKVFLSLPDNITETAYPNVPAWKDISTDLDVVSLYPNETSTKWEATKSILEDIIINGNYELMTSFADLFKPANKHNSESVFEVEYMSNQLTNQGSPFYTSLSPIAYRPTGLPNANKYVAPLIFTQGAGNCQPTGYFMDASRKWDSNFPNYNTPKLFEGKIYSDSRISNGELDKTTGMPINNNLDYPQDETYPYDPYTGISFRIVYKGYGADGHFMCGKYQSPSETRGSDSNDNFYILRYADILLMLVEAETHIANGVPSQEILDNTINAVRSRAGIAPYSNGSDPTGIQINSKEEMLDAILDERYLE